MDTGNFFTQLSHNWKLALKNSRFRWWIIAGAAILIILVWLVNGFFQWVQRREGITLYDPVLSLFHPIELSTPICLTINLITGLAIIVAAKNPLRFMRLLYAYITLLLMRVLTIYLIPLNPPEGIIPLKDPLLMLIAYGNTMITKDLFFSGHVSMMVLVLLGSEQRWLRWLLLVSTVFVATGILIMRAHYTIDILAAPIFALLAWVAAKVLLQKGGN